MVEPTDKTFADLAGDPSEETWSPPVSFDGFEVVRLLGQGGMGSVYLAQDTTLDRPVAIKFIAVAAEPGSEARGRFLIEARAIARLQHPNVVGVHRLGEVGGRPYLVSEFVDGETLQELQKPVSWQRALCLGLGVARGLAAAHRAGVLHRDMKPANVVVTTGGEVKLLDFGIAKLVEVAQEPRPPRAGGAVTRAADAVPATSLTSTGILLGTPLYMAPELWDEEPASPRSDVYALGLVLYELLAGEVPHAAAAARGLHQLAAAVRQSDPPPLGGRNPTLPRPLAQAVERCLRRDPALRFADAGELCAALSDVHEVYHTLSAPTDALATPDEASLVSASFARVATRIDPFVARFYALLFERRPDVQPLFPADLGPQRAKLAGVIHLAVDNLRRPERLVPILEDLGLRHAAYGIHAGDFDAVGEALLGALKEFDPAWGTPLERAWASAYQQIAGAMRRGLVEARAA